MNRFSLNQATTKRWPLDELVAGCVAAGVRAVGLWREEVAAHGLDEAAALVRDAGLAVSSLCRGGFFDRPGWHDENRRAIEEAAALGTDTLVLVSGGLPGDSRDLDGARRHVGDAIGALVPDALAAGVRLAVEPLHPMFCADRCVVATLGQALEIAAPHPAEAVGVVVDTYHLWWDDQVWRHIAEAGRQGRIASFQLADWITPLPEGVLLGRGLPGTGAVDLRRFAVAVADAGYDGWVEVEVFHEDVWSRPGAEVLAEALDGYPGLHRVTTLEVGGVPVAGYVAEPDLDIRLAPRPYLHPVRTLAGTVVTEELPDDHRWHLGVSVTMQDVDGVNLWGGRTYVRDRGYIWRDDHGRIRPVAHHTTGNGFTEELHWCDGAGRLLLRERRAVTARAASCGWELRFSYALSAPGPADVVLGSPATNGRTGAGYGGFFWRATTAEAVAFTGDGADPHGSAADWLALVVADGYTLVFRGLGGDDRWFVRTGEYNGVCAALAFTDPLTIRPGRPLTRDLRVLVADGAVSRDQIIAASA